MRRLTTILLFALIAVSISLMWAVGKWATTIPETGAFLIVALWAVEFLRGAPDAAIQFRSDSVCRSHRSRLVSAGRRDHRLSRAELAFDSVLVR